MLNTTKLLWAALTSSSKYAIRKLVLWRDKRLIAFYLLFPKF